MLESKSFDLNLARTAGMLSGARRVATMLLVTLLLTMTAQTAWAEDWPEYITDVIVCGASASNIEDVKDTYKNNGYTFCEMDLNDGAGGNYIYLGYKKDSRADVNGGYITNFYISNSKNSDGYIDYDGKRYYLCPTNSGFDGDLNDGAGGKYIYLYYTKANFPDMRVVSDISFNDNSSNAVGLEGASGGYDLNTSVGGSDIYMHLTTTTKTNRPSSDPVKASSLTYDGTAKQLITTAATLANGTMYYRIGDSGEWKTSISQLTATNHGYYTVQYYAGSTSYSDASSIHSISGITIFKAPNSGVTVSCANTAEGIAPAPQLGGTNLSTGAVTYTYSNTQNGTYTQAVPTAIGTYYVKATIAADANHYAFTTAAASFKIVRDWALYNNGGSEADAYVISTPAELDLLAQRVNAGNNYSGKFFKLGDNITYQKNTENNYTPIGKRIGGNDYPFSGTFDGNKKTISGLNMNLSETEYVGLFGYTCYATIKNLTISNSTIAGLRYVGGIVGYGGDSNTIVQNCAVTNSVIVSATSIDVGGIVGLYATVRGCVSAATVSGMQFTGGIIGCGDGTSVEHCLYTGSSVTASAACPYGGAIIGKLGAGMTANYYTQVTIGGVGNDDNTISSDENGARKAVAIGAATGVTVTPTGTATTYDVSGITAYDGNSGILYGKKLYAGAGETVRLNIAYTVPDGYIFNGGFTDGSGNALADNGDGTYTLTMTSAALTVTPADVTDLWGITAGRDGSTAAKAYRISTPAGLDLLASKVKGGTEYQNTYFELGDDIEYDYTGLAENESNYTPIGGDFKSVTRIFKGHFDGKGHTVSGIRFKSTDYDKGLFGNINSDAVVKNVTLSDARITGNKCTGGIVGYNYGTVENCHTLSTVTILTVENNTWYWYQGGIVGENHGTVKGCTSAATVRGHYGVGGIVGVNYYFIQDCLVLGGSVSGRSYVGAIVGYEAEDGTLTNNYHTLSGMGGVNGSDTDGARFAVAYDTKPDDFGDATATYGEGDYIGIKAYGTKGLEYNGKYYYYDADLVVLEDQSDNFAANNDDLKGKPAIFNRSFATDVASTICLPFPMTDIEGGNVYEFVGVEYDATANSGAGAWVATMTDATPDGNKVTSTEANKPYLFMPTSTGNVTFRGTIPSAADSYDAGTTTSADGFWTFHGTYSRLVFGTNLDGAVYGFASTAAEADENQGAVDAGEFVRADTGAGVPPFRCYLTYSGSNSALQARGVTRGESEEVPETITVRLIGKNGDINGIGTLTLSTGKFSTDGWYSLDGRRLDGKPTKKGLYIHDREKVVIK